MSSDGVRDEVGEESGVDILPTLTTDQRHPSPPDSIWLYRLKHERAHLWTETGVKLQAHPRPPFYIDPGVTEWQSSDTAFSPDDEDIELNGSLVGVKGAEEAVKQYEVAVGIAYELDPSLAVFYPSRVPLFLGELSDDYISQAVADWEKLVGGFLDGIFDPCEFEVALDPSYSTNFWDMDLSGLSDNDRSNSGISPDTSSSDLSLDSDSDPPPATPYVDRKSYAEVLFDERARVAAQDGTHVSVSPSKPLNASALSFVPAFSLDLDNNSPPSPTSDLPYVSPTYEYHFPSLHKQSPHQGGSRSVPPPLQRDEHGFYMEVSPSPSPAATRSSTPKRQSNRAVQGILDQSPSPTRSRSTSKTRELVDRLRSSAPSRRQRKNKGETSSLRHSMDSLHSQDQGAGIDNDVEDVDGWITTLEGAELSASRRQEDWVQGLFQCRSRSQSLSKSRNNHQRSSSTSTTYTPTTPSSASSHLGAMPLPATSVSSPPPTKPPSFNAAFTPIQPFMQFPLSYAAYASVMPSTMAAPHPMMHMPQGWPLQMLTPMPPTFPTSMPMYVHHA
ncbi:hypothetical protein BDW22DRAFT_1355923 [Trametopsis cervina]|nr:hypothetical protein BDW22DRAFT_1355923 [Trametopsis cervina]